MKVKKITNENTIDIFKEPSDIFKEPSDDPDWKEKINTQILQQDEILMHKEVWDFLVEDYEWMTVQEPADRIAYRNDTLTAEDIHQVYYEVVGQGFQIQPIYINIDEDDEDVNDWLDEYFLTYAPQSSCSATKDCETECKKECKDEKKCCVKCTCTIKDLMAYGCRCGAAKKEKDNK